MNYIKKIKERLPKGIKIENNNSTQTLEDLNITESEFISILSWLSLFTINGIKKRIPYSLPNISKRMHLDFGLVASPDKNNNHVIYICVDNKRGIKRACGIFS